MADDVEHLVCVYWPLYVFFGEIPTQNLLPFLKLGYLSFYYWVTRVLYMFQSSLSGTWVAEFSCHFVICLFTLLIVSFREQKFEILMKSNLLFSCVACVIIKIIVNLESEKFMPVFSSKSFTVLALILGSLLYFEWVFVYTVR